jgi:hypothetical protein
MLYLIQNHRNVLEKVLFGDLATPANWSDRTLAWSEICPFDGPMGSQGGPVVLWYDIGGPYWSSFGPVGPQLDRDGPMGVD